MKRTILFLAIALSTARLHALPAFPGAEGWGAETPGGRGGKVYIVDTLEGIAEGSLYHALNAREPRIIVFRVSGVIETRGFSFQLAHSNVTIAGQTSPGGVTLVNRLNANDVLGSYAQNFGHGVFRFLRMRGLSNNTDDCVSFNTCNNMVFDHCEFSGGQDECFSIPAGHDYTVQWCAVHNSTPNVGGSGWGGSLMSNSHVSIHHNLWANNFARYPNTDWSYTAIPDSGRYDMVNNIVYNTQRTYGMGSGGHEKLVNMTGCLFIQGPSTEEIRNQLGISAWVYARDNFNYLLNGTHTDLCSGAGLINTYGNLRYGDTVSVRWPMPEATVYPSAQAYDTVLAKVGALPRDTMMRRTVAEVHTRTGEVKNYTYDLLTYAPLPAGPFPDAPADGDRDGMPDFWESAVGLNPSDSSDQAGDFDQTGYTNIEKYVNDLALARLCRNYYYPVYPIPADWPDYNPSCCQSVSAENLPVRENVFLTLTPNPFNPGTVVRLPEGAAQPGVLDIFSIDGKHVCRLAGTAQRAVAWNGRDAAGKQAAPGAYLFRLRSGTRTLWTKGVLAN